MQIPAPAPTLLSVLLVGASLAASAPVSAVDLNKSILTPIQLEKCRRIGRHPDGGAWVCKGLRGYPVYVAEGDLRFMLAFGPKPQARRSATQTLGPFNTIFQGKRRAMIEWRVEHDARRRIVPFATIVRYYTSRDGERGEMIVVTKVDARESCQLAVVDARANLDAMAQARAWANAEARRRPCPEEPIDLGQPAAKPK
jgi:hypothetical protein